MGFEGDPFAFCVFSPLLFCAFLSDELVKDKIRVDGLAFFCNYDLPLEGGVDSGFQQVLGKFFVCAFEPEDRALYFDEVAVDLAV